jgi:hypothetical protein
MYQTFTKTAKKTKNLFRSILFLAFMASTGLSFGQSYCTPTIANHCCNMGSAKVEINSGSVLSKSTTWDQNTTYWDYFNTVSGCIAPSTNYTINITVGPTYNYAVCVWVDWDKNGTFDASEKIDSIKNTQPNAVVNFTMSVPSSSTGSYRMRVLTDYSYYYSNAGAIFSPCTSGNNGNGWYAYGDYQDYQLFVPGSSVDAKMIAITQPTNLIIGNNDVTVSIKNLSSTTIDSARFYYQVGNGSIIEEKVTGMNLTTCGTKSYTFNTKLNISTGGFYNIKSWVKFPNGASPDADDKNDSAFKLTCTSIGGNFTIDPSLAASATNYQSFSAAAYALNTCGINAPVKFTIAAGTYNEEIEIGNVNGSSSTNTITFDGVDNTTTKITSANKYTIKLNNASYVTIKNLAVYNTGNSANVLWLTNASNDNNFDSLDVKSSSTSTNVVAYGIMGSTYSSYGIWGDNNVMDHSTISGGYFTTVSNGKDNNTKATGNIIRNCTINNQGYACYNFYNDGYKFEHNVVTTYYSYFYYCSNTDIIQNEFKVNSGYPLYTFYCSNMNIINNSFSGSNMYYGIYAYSLAGANIFHNSFYSQYSNAYGVYFQQQCSNIDFRNNSLWMEGTSSYAIYSQNASFFSACEYNNYYCPKAANLLYIGQAYPNLAAVVGQNGINNIAMSSQPNYVNTSSTPYDLHVTSTVFSLYGDPTVGVTVDLDNDTRCSVAPTLGCDESQFQQSLPTSDFTVNDTVYVNSPVNALNKAALNQGKVFNWGVDGSYGVATTLNLKTTFGSVGTHTIDLITTNCAGSDTISKTVVVVNPTTKPIADFLANRNLVEVNETVQFANLSSGGDTAWTWTVTQGTQGIDWDFNSGDAYSYDADIIFMTPGKYEVCLESFNSVGSNKVCKTNYIEVITAELMCNNTLVTSPSGRFYDDGGKTGSYKTGNFTCDMLIDPCASSVTMTFTKFDVYNTYGYLRVWDGKDAATGKPLHTGQGWTGQSNPGTLVAKSGKMYIQFRSTYNYQAQGWAAEWVSTPGQFSTPSANFTFPSTIYAGGTANMAVKNQDPNTNYEWFVAGNSEGVSPSLNYLFAASGSYDVCVVATSCGGVDTVCKNINVINPTAAPTVDFKVDYDNNINGCFTTSTNKVRVNLGDTVLLSDLSTQGPNAWSWSSSSSHVIFLGNTTDPTAYVTFDSVGTFDISLDATNSIGTGSLTKSNYIEVGAGYCVPSVSNLISDIGINSVEIGTINNQSASGLKAYTNYTNSASACLARGGKYPFTISRNTNLNPINRKIWIDLNQDGTFGANEAIAVQSSNNVKTWTDSVTIPTSALLGKTTLRIGASFSGQSNTPCGANQFGEFEDYTVYVIADLQAPVITLVGSNPAFVERGKAYTDAGATAWDAVDGNITSNIVVTGIPASTTNIDTFYVSYNVSDAAGNTANTVKRMVLVTNDATGPVINLNGGANFYVEVNNAFVDPGANAYDSVYGAINAANISTSGSVNTSVLGVYYITYTACDAANNCSNIKRTVTVGDTTKPTVTLAGNNPFNLTVGTTFNDPGVQSISDNYWNNLTSTTSSNLNKNVVGTYQVTYSSVDGSGNIGTAIRTVVVVDDIAPTIKLIGGDTLYLEAVKNMTFVDPGFYATDNYYPTVSWNNTGTVTIDKTTLDQPQTLTYSATDASGNTSNKNRVVIVRKTTKPWVTLIGNTLDIVSWGPAGSTYTDPGINKNDYFFDAADLTPSTTGSVDMTVPGVYELKYSLTDPKSNISLTVSRIVNVVVRTGIANASNDNTVNVYPNPSTGIVNIEIAGDVKYNSIEITNTLGQQVYTSSSNLVSGVHAVDLSNKATGIYFITIRNNDNVVVKKVKIVNN